MTSVRRLFVYGRALTDVEALQLKRARNAMPHTSWHLQAESCPSPPRSDFDSDRAFAEHLGEEANLLVHLLFEVRLPLLGSKSQAHTAFPQSGGTSTLRRLALQLGGRSKGAGTVHSRGHGTCHRALRDKVATLVGRAQGRQGLGCTPGCCLGVAHARTGALQVCCRLPAHHWSPCLHHPSRQSPAPQSGGLDKSERQASGLCKAPLYCKA